LSVTPAEAFDWPRPLIQIVRELKLGNSGALGIGRTKLCELVRFSFRVGLAEVLAERDSV
jgi:hypothetical protein